MKISEAKLLLTEIVKYNIDQIDKGHKTFIVPCYIGDPGVGKTAVPNQVAAELGIPYHCTIVAQYDAGEMAGLPFPQEVEFEQEDGTVVIQKRMRRLRPSYMPDPMADDGKVAVWNLDELPQAVLANQNICSQLVNEWRIGEHPVSPGVTICCTGNKPENKAGTTPMPMHLRDRLMFIPIDVDHEESMIYASQKGWHFQVRAFLQGNPKLLHMFEVGVWAYPSPRSWEKVSCSMHLNVTPHISHEAISGQVGEGAAGTFTAWLRVQDRMPDPRDVIARPLEVPVFGNQDADVLYLLLANLVEIATEKNVEPQIEYIKRLPNQEFAALWMRDLLNRHPHMNEVKKVTAYKTQHMPKLF